MILPISEYMPILSFHPKNDYGCTHNNNKLFYHNWGKYET